MNAADKFRQLLDTPTVQVRELGEFLDRCSPAERVDVIRSLGGTATQKRLYDLAGANPRVTIDQMVPPDAAPLREVIFEGKNSLPAFTLFQKRFCRPPKERAANELWGYNHQTLAWLTGPGYFVCHDDPKGAAVDYTRVPPQSAPGWPAVKPNDRGVSNFVYANMVDYMRRISEHVFIGSAWKAGKEFNSYFLLCRQ